MLRWDTTKTRVMSGLFQDLDRKYWSTTGTSSRMHVHTLVVFAFMVSTCSCGTHDASHVVRWKLL